MKWLDLFFKNSFSSGLLVFDPTLGQCYYSARNAFLPVTNADDKYYDDDDDTDDDVMVTGMWRYRFFQPLTKRMKIPEAFMVLTLQVHQIIVSLTRWLQDLINRCRNNMWMYSSGKFGPSNNTSIKICKSLSWPTFSDRQFSHPQYFPPRALLVLNFSTNL